jgi:hypothetical protein
MVLYQALAGVDELGRQLSGLAPALELVGRTESAAQGPSKERRVREPKALLDEWKKKQNLAGPKPVIRRYYVPMGSNYDKLRAAVPR